MSEFEDLFGEWGVLADGTPKPLNVEPYLGTGSKGPNYGPLVSLPGLMQTDKRTLLRNALGNEVISESLVLAPTALGGNFPLHSRVTLATGRVTTVEAIAEINVEGVFDFVKVFCA